MRRRTLQVAPYPPGPNAFPFIGHTFQVPNQHTWRYFHWLSQKYGPVVRLSLAGNDTVVLSDAKDAEEILVHRSHNYSSRKQLIYAGKYQSQNKRLVLLPYGTALKQQRAAFHQMLKPRVVGAYEFMQEIESTKFLLDFLVRPENTDMHCKRFAAAMVFYLSYGRRLPNDGQDLNAVLAVLDNFTKDTYPGAHLVDTLPILDRLPDFLAPWRTEACTKHEKEMKLYIRLVLEVNEAMLKGNFGIECFSARLWEKQRDLGLDIKDIAYIAGSAFEAGTDTTAGTFQWFLMAMLLYPDTMRKAQGELDAILGADGKTLPCFANMKDLPYCTALVKEVFRWSPVAPGGFPHYSDTDDEYKGYLIKAKTMVIPCVWSMHRNPKEFADPGRFEPERFLRQGGCDEPESLTEGHYGFGFGRRICPGQHLGSKTIWIGITRLLWAFTIEPTLDAEGNPTAVDPDNCTSGMSSKPINLPLRVTARSKRHEETILREWEEVRENKSL